MSAVMHTMDTPSLPSLALDRGPGRQTYKAGRRISPLGLAVMVGAHALIGYALVSGLARKAVEVIKKPLDATIIQEVKIPPPPPPPPPKPEIRTESLKVDQPPPSYVAPPEVTPPTAVAGPSITAVQQQDATPTPPPMAPPIAPAPVVAKPVSTDIAVACPKQVKPDVPERAIEEGIGGTVRAEVRIRGNKVVDVRPLSGPRVFYPAVRAAVMRYECHGAPDVDTVATQDFTFKIDE
jgi:protein TonB